jgi:hypothetical protein
VASARARVRRRDIYVSVSFGYFFELVAMDVAFELQLAEGDEGLDSYERNGL